MSSLEIYRCTPRQVRSFVIDCVQAGLVPFIKSSPGMGKSSIVKSIAEEFNMHLIDHRLSTSTQEDLNGLPRFITDAQGRDRATFVPFDIFPTEGTPIPDGKDGWMLFLDEANAASKSVQAASYKLVLDRYVGQEKLHKKIAMVMAGNLTTDKSIVMPLSTAMQSRVIHIEMQTDFKEWLTDVAIPHGYDSRILGFLNYKTEYLMDFDPDHTDSTFCCPRTWEFMNNLIKGKAVEDQKTPLYAGTISSGVAVSFVQFCKVIENMPNLRLIESDPLNAPVPHDSPTRWMVTTHLADNVTDQNFEALTKYVGRMNLEFKVLFYRTVHIRNPNIKTHPAFASAMGEVAQYLFG
jgi:uncharacterized protein YifN (PemK superfamily)